MTKPYVLMIVTNDTKGSEAAYIRTELETRGLSVIHLDASIRGEDNSSAEINPQQIAAVSGLSMDQIRAFNHEGRALAIMAEGAIQCARSKDKEIGLSGIIGIGGGMGTTLSTAVMRTFGYGLPKVMISTLASGYTRPFIGCSDIMMVNSVCDISGFNSISTAAYRNGAIALAAQAKEYKRADSAQRPLIMVTTLSTTDPCTLRVRSALEAHNCEVMVFHTLGNGGRTMEELLRQRHVSAVVDVSLLEINSFLQNRQESAGASRGSTALSLGIPTIFAPGNIDFLVSGPIEEARQRYPHKRLHMHNSAQTAVRSERDELLQLAEHLARLTGNAQGPVSFYIPLQGFSEHDSPRGPFHDPSLPPVFAAHFKSACSPDIDVREFDCHINDPEFAEAIVKKVLGYIEAN